MRLSLEKKKKKKKKNNKNNKRSRFNRVLAPLALRYLQTNIFIKSVKFGADWTLHV